MSTHWLSLERCMERALNKFMSLRSYSLSESFPDQKFKRLEGCIFKSHHGTCPAVPSSIYSQNSTSFCRELNLQFMCYSWFQQTFDAPVANYIWKLSSGRGSRDFRFGICNEVPNFKLNFESSCTGQNEQY